MVKLKRKIYCLILLICFWIISSKTFNLSKQVLALGSSQNTSQYVSIPRSFLTLYITPTASPTQSPTPTVPQTVGDLDTYEKIASQAIQSSNNTLEQMKWMMGIISTVVLGIAGSVVGYFVKTQKELTDYSKEMQKKFNAADQKFESAERQLRNISSNYLQLLHELNHQSIIFLPPEMAMTAFEEGRISPEQYRESQIWFSWANWYYGGNEEGFLQLQIYKNSPLSLPTSIRRIMILEIEQINNRARTRGMIFDKEQELLMKILKLLDLALPNAAMDGS
jgi:hypothetical protein